MYPRSVNRDLGEAAVFGWFWLLLSWLGIAPAAVPFLFGWSSAFTLSWAIIALRDSERTPNVC